MVVRRLKQVLRHLSILVQIEITMTIQVEIVRALNSNHDWTFGASLNDYLQGNAAIAQTINTRLSSFLGNCFFDLQTGIDWFNLLGSIGNEVTLNLAISTLILNTPNVTGILQLSISLPTNRNFSVSYQVQTIYSTVTSNFVFDNSIGG